MISANFNCFLTLESICSISSSFVGSFLVKDSETVIGFSVGVSMKITSSSDESTSMMFARRVGVSFSSFGTFPGI